MKSRRTLRSQRNIDLAAASDSTLLALTRDGVTEAFSELWTRHSGAVLTSTGSSTSFEAEDLMQEAFERVFIMVSNREDPLPISFRAYVATTAKRIAIDQSNKAHGITSESMPYEESAAIEVYPDFADRVLTDSTTAEAFRMLTPRYREVLWYRDVEDIPVQEITRYVGLNVNSTANLIRRAREAFKDAWLQVQLSPHRNLPPECKAIIPQLGRYARDRLTTDERSLVHLHLMECTHCAVIASEADSLHKKLALILLPLLFLGSAPGYRAWIESKQNQTPLPAQANVVQVQIVGVRTAPGAKGRLTPITSFPRTPKMTLAAAAAASILIAGAGTAAAVWRPSAEPVETSTQSSGPPVSTNAPEPNPRATADTVATDIPVRTTPTPESEPVQTYYQIGSTSAAPTTSIPVSPLPTVPVPAPTPTTPPPAVDPIVYPKHRDLSSLASTSPFGLQFVGTPTATIHMLITGPGIIPVVGHKLELTSDANGITFYDFAPYAGLSDLTVTVAQSYPTAAGIYLADDPSEMLTFNSFAVPSL